MAIGRCRSGATCSKAQIRKRMTLRCGGASTRSRTLFRRCSTGGRRSAVLEAQRLSETQRIDGVVRRHDLDCDEPALGFLQNDLARRKNRVPDAVEGYL